MKKLLILLTFLLPNLVSAQVFNQNQVVFPPYINSGIIFATSSAGNSKLTSISTTTLYTLLGITSGGDQNWYVDSDGNLAPTSTIDVKAARDFIMDFQGALRSDDSGNTLRQLITIGGSDQVEVGDNVLTTNIMGASLIIPVLSGTLYADGSGVVSPQTGTQGVCTEWGVGGTLVDAASGLPCGSGGSGGATTTINGVNGPTFLFDSSNAALTYSTTTGTVTLNLSTSTLQAQLTGSSTPFWAASGTHIYKTNAGNVGLGTTTPVNLLSLYSSAPNIQLSSNAGGSGVQARISYDQLNFGRASIAFGTAATGNGFQSFFVGSGGLNEALRIDGTGNVGIGSTTPGAKLSIHSISSNPATSTLFTIATSSAAGTGTTTLFTVLGNGNVGIGTTSPFSKLTIQGTVGTMPLSVASSSGRIVLEVEQSGNVGISTTTAGFPLSVEGVAHAGSLNLLASSSPTYRAGTLTYDTGNESLTFFNNDSNVALQIGQEQWVRVRNDTGSTIVNGAAVYISGTHASGIPNVSLARADAGATAIVTGLATESIANNSIGYITSTGLVRGLNTSGFSNGATVYLSATTSGALTNVVPSSTYPTTTYRIRVGIVTNSNSSNGTIHVTPTTGFPASGPAGGLLTVSTTTGMLGWTSTSTLGLQPSGNYITSLTGDVTASGPGSVAATLATVNGNVGSFGGSTAIPNFTVNGKGLITAAGTNAVIAPAGTLTGATLAANVLSSSLTSLGTIANLTFTNATGTNLRLLGELVDSSNSPGTFGQVLLSTATSTRWTATSSLGFLSSLVGTTGQVAYFSSTNNVVGTSSLFIDSNGRVGIGSTTPVARLSIEASATSSPFFTIGSSTSKVLEVSQSSSPRFGIGTSTPTTEVEILGNGFFSGSLTAGNFTATGTGIIRGNTAIGTSTNTGARLAVQGLFGATLPLFDIATTTSLSSATTSIFRVNHFGNVGIGTSTPSGPLSIHTTGLANTAYVLNIATSTAGGNATSSVLSILANGNIGVASTSPDMALSVLAGKAIHVGEYTITPTSSVMAIDFTKGNKQRFVMGGGAITLTAAATTTFAGSNVLLTICNSNFVSGAVTFSGFKWPGGTVGTHTTTAGACDSFNMVALTGSTTPFVGVTVINDWK
jgi:hypothetical protein